MFSFFFGEQMNRIIKQIHNEFLKNNIDQSDADWIVCEVCGCSRGEIGTIKPTPKQLAKIKIMAKKRLRHVPLAQIIHSRNFYGLDLYINKHVLIPRFETEGLCELVSKTMPTNVLGEVCGLDLGTGSGAISVVLTKLFGYKMTAVDISRKALAVAKKNSKKHDCNITFVRSNMAEKLYGKRFDFVVSNPPYILSKDLPKLSKEVVKHEPHLALNGGGDGLQFYRKIVTEAPLVLKDNGYLFFEIGKDLESEVMRLMKKDFNKICVKRDMDGVNRYVYGQLKRKREII